MLQGCVYNEFTHGLFVSPAPTSLQLVKQKYNVDIPIKDVTAANWRPGGDFLISLQYRKPVNSVFGSLVKSEYIHSLS